tara:strand:- start:1766 stop:2029 length:264 start_codon:yes stop_codon:yes gene_type:complete
VNVKTDFNLIVGLITYLEEPRQVKEIAQEFNLVERTAYRYLTVLRTSGFKIIVIPISGSHSNNYQVTDADVPIKRKIKKLHEQFKIH